MISKIRACKRSAYIRPPRLKYGDTIGIACPCSPAIKHRIERFSAGLNAMGFQVRLPQKLYRQSWRYIASAEDRRDDLIELAADPDVKMVLFGGGESGNEFLNELDYDVLRRHPKIYCSYSNGTALLSIISAQTGMETVYGQFPGVFENLTDFDRRHFEALLMQEKPECFIRSNQWQCLRPGIASGILIGGYALVLSQLANHPLFQLPHEPLLLFLEDHERFSSVPAVLSSLAWIEQSSWFPQVQGLIFGCYQSTPNLMLMEGLQRLAQRHSIPVVMTDDFGHGLCHGLLPIGRRAVLNSQTGQLYYEYFD